MIKKIAIISLSRGLLGESFISHEKEIGLKRLKKYGVDVVIMPNADKGLKYVEENPNKRADDLLEAFSDDSIDMILCAIGGNDTYRLLPYLFENDKLKKVVKNKVFLGFSDTTFNHFMLNKVGINSFYGQSFLSDVCEIGPQMLPYTKKYFEELINTGKIKKITPSDVWYEDREDYSKEAIGTTLPEHKNDGFELLQGGPIFSGKILGGCIESINDMLTNITYPDTLELCEKYKLFPTLSEWTNKILLLESSEDKSTPMHYEEMLLNIKNTGILDVISGIIVGKPANETYYNEYKDLLVKVVGDKNLPILYNVNIGHATPRCIIPFGVIAHVNANKQEIVFEY